MTAGPVGAGAATLAIALAGIRSRKSMREIAVDLYGADRVGAEWSVDSWMRAQVQRLVFRARAAARAEAPVERGAMPCGAIR